MRGYARKRQMEKLLQLRAQLADRDTLLRMKKVAAPPADQF